jgi:DNA-binding GntR family transcriptional regulator
MKLTPEERKDPLIVSNRVKRALIILHNDLGRPVMTVEIAKALGVKTDPVRAILGVLIGRGEAKWVKDNPGFVPLGRKHPDEYR